MFKNPPTSLYYLKVYFEVGKYSTLKFAEIKCVEFFYRICFVIATANYCHLLQGFFPLVTLWIFCELPKNFPFYNVKLSHSANRIGPPKEVFKERSWIPFSALLSPILRVPPNEGMEIAPCSSPNGGASGFSSHLRLWWLMSDALGGPFNKTRFDKLPLLDIRHSSPNKNNRYFL